MRMIMVDLLVLLKSQLHSDVHTMDLKEMIILQLQNKRFYKHFLFVIYICSCAETVNSQLTCFFIDVHY